MQHDLLEPWKVQVLNGGKIAIRVVAFDQGAGNDFVFAEQALVRLNANGTLDTTFHGDGIVVVSAGTSDVTWNPDGSAFASSYRSVRRWRSGRSPCRGRGTTPSPRTVD